MFKFFRICEIIHLRQIQLWWHPDFFFGLSKLKKIQNELLIIIHGLSRRVFQLKKQMFREKTLHQDDTTVGWKPRLPLLDLLLEIAPTNLLTDKEIEDEVETFITTVITGFFSD